MHGWHLSIDCTGSKSTSESKSKCIMQLFGIWMRELHAASCNYRRVRLGLGLGDEIVLSVGTWNNVSSRQGYENSARYKSYQYFPDPDTEFTFLVTSLLLQFTIRWPSIPALTSMRMVCHLPVLALLGRCSLRQCIHSLSDSGLPALAHAFVLISNQHLDDEKEGSEFMEIVAHFQFIISQGQVSVVLYIT
jgi:hypothetical protein